jgi:glycosyltransferase involved in cell wall biosynthesis
MNISEFPSAVSKRLTATRLYVNGRFLTQRQTGVQRFALETLMALDAQWGSDPRLRSLPPPIVLTPRETAAPNLRHLEFRPFGKLQGHAWEQLELPAASSDGFLLNFGATGPLLKRRQLVTVHDAAVHVVPEAYSFPFRAWYKTLIPLLGRSTAGVVTVSQFSKTQLQKHFRIPTSKLWLTSEGREHIERTPEAPNVVEAHGLKPGEYFLAVSSLSPHKNFGVISQALKHLIGSGITVAIVGQTDSAVFHALSDQETSLVKLLGYVSDSELKTLLVNALALIHPSRYEGFGLAPLEAMAVGCPVLASNAAAIPEVCGDAVWYFAPQDAVGLAELMTQLANDPSARAALRAAGLLRARNFRWRDASAAYVNVLSELGVLPQVPLDTTEPISIGSPEAAAS